MKRWISFILLAFCASAFAHSYKYRDLIIADYDEMSHQVQIRIKKARELSQGEGSGNEHEAVEELRDALKLIMSRPDTDNMVAKLTPDVRRELGNYSAFEDSISSLAAEALGIVKDDKATVVQRSTNLFVLENVLGEIRPEAAGNPDLRRVVQRIADARIKIESEVAKDRKMNSMFKSRNPTEVAEEILKALPKEKKK